MFLSPFSSISELILKYMIRNSWEGLRLSVWEWNKVKIKKEITMDLEVRKRGNIKRGKSGEVTRGWNERKVKKKGRSYDEVVLKNSFANPIARGWVLQIETLFMCLLWQVVLRWRASWRNTLTRFSPGKKRKFLFVKHWLLE